jgi:hypothetical protein
MLPRLIGVTAFIFTAMAISGLVSSASASDVRTMPMQFEWHREGPAGVCGDNCRVWISAIGAITRDTSKDFATFARDHDVNGATLVLDSSGGSVLGTLALGRVIRQFGMTTTVGKTQTLPAGGPDEGRATLSSRAECESMCAFLLLSGTKRFVPPEAQVLVHEIWLGDRRDDAAAAAYSAEDIVVVQRDIGRLAQYTVEMGGSIDLLEAALRIPPWEPMRRLSPSELRRMKLDTVAGLPDHGSQAAAVSPASGRPVGRASTFTDRGWKMSEKSGPPTLTRRHPLTQEGDEIGNFDLSFACGDTSDTYNVTYTERRRGLETRPASEALKQVTIAVGRRSVQLDVIASEVRAKPYELDSTARGVVPAALIKALATEGNRSLTISAATTGNVETVIRMGNTGVAQNLPRFASGCSEQAARRVGTHAELLPANAAAAAGN